MAGITINSNCNIEYDGTEGKYKFPIKGSDGVPFAVDVTISSAETPTFTFYYEDNKNPGVLYQISERDGSNIMQGFTAIVDTTGLYAIPVAVPQSADWLWIEVTGVTDSDVELFANSGAYTA